MLKAKVEYVGQSEHGKEDRFAVINAPAENSAIISDILDEIGYKYDGFGDPDECNYWIKVEDREDYNYFMKEWKKAKKAYNGK